MKKLRKNLDKHISGLIVYIRDSFSDAFPRRVWLIPLVLYVCITTPILYLTGYTSEDIWWTSYRYILSAQAQTLGTVLALVASFTLVAAQLVTRYGHLLLRRILAPWVFWYAVPFLIGIIAPLFLLNSYFELWVARLTLLLGGMCIILLIPFFVAVRRQLSMASLIDDLRVIICDSSSERDATHALKSLSAVLLGALKLRDYETFNLGMDSIEQASQTELSGERVWMIAVELGLLVPRSSDDQIAMVALSRMINNVSLHVYEGEDVDVRRRLISNLADTYGHLTSEVISNFIGEVKVIKELAVEETTHPDNGIARECQRLLYNMGRVTIVELDIHNELPIHVISALREIAQECINKPAIDDRKNIIRASIRITEDLGILANNKKLPGLAEVIVEQLRCIEKPLAGYDGDLLRAAKAARESIQSNIGN
jgi:hypothetical protein